MGCPDMSALFKAVAQSPGSRHSKKAQLLPPRSSEAAAALRTHDDVRPALTAAGHADRVYDALHSVSRSEAPLYLRLTHVGRKHLPRCALTVHVESRPVQCCLNCHSLLTLDHLLLCLASDECQHTTESYE